MKNPQSLCYQGGSGWVRLGRSVSIVNGSAWLDHGEDWVAMGEASGPDRLTPRDKGG